MLLNAVYINHIPLADNQVWISSYHNENPAYSAKEFYGGAVDGLLLVDNGTLSLLQRKKLQPSRLEAMCSTHYKLTVRSFGSVNAPFPDAHSVHFVFLKDIGIFSITAFHLYPGLRIYAVMKLENIYCIPEVDPGIEQVMNIIRSGRSNLDVFIKESFFSLGRKDLKNITAQKNIIKWAGPLPGVSPALIEKGDIIWLKDLQKAVVRDILKTGKDYFFALEDGYSSYIRRYPENSEVVIIKGKAKKKTIIWFEKEDRSYLEAIGREAAAEPLLKAGDRISFKGEETSVLLSYQGFKDNILHLILRSEDGIHYRTFNTDFYKNNFHVPDYDTAGC